MKFMPIIGSNFQNLSSLGNISQDILVLADNVNNNGYTNFYKYHKFKIIDNMVFEKEESVDIDTLLQKAKLIDADEIIVPDSLYDGVETIENLKNFISSLSKEECNNYQLQVVIQGKDLDDYVYCFRRAMTYTEVNTLGLSCLAIPHVLKDITGTDDVMTNRTMMLCYLEHLNLLDDAIIYNNKEFHCLGLGTNPAELLFVKGMCRSCDSSLPFWMAQEGIDLTDSSRVFRHYVQKPRYHDRMDKLLMTEEIELAVKNIKYCLKLAEEEP